MSKFQEMDEPQAVYLRAYRTMLEMFRSAQTPAQLDEVACIFILDPVYERSDIALAIHTAELEKGWHR